MMYRSLGRFWLASLGCSLPLAFALPAQAQPDPRSVTGELRSGATVVVSGQGFGTKPFGPPLFWWTADGGDRPSPLGRLRNWSAGWDGDDERQQVVVAAGSRGHVPVRRGCWWRFPRPFYTSARWGGASTKILHWTLSSGR
jgi:hypothetical protein